MKKDLPTAPVPAGMMRHPVSGCIILKADEEAHEAALAHRRNRHFVNASPDAGAPAAHDLQAALELEVERNRRLELEVELEKLRANARASTPTIAQVGGSASVGTGG